MFYSDLYLQEKSRPSKVLIGMALVAVVSFAIFYYTSDAAPTRASKMTVKQHEIVNVTARQAGIFWESASADQAWILYGSGANNTDKVALDERDNLDTKADRIFHYAVIKDLQPETTYHYKIISNNEIVTTGDGSSFTFTTAPDSGSSGLLTPAYGKVALTSGSPAVQAFVMLNVPESYPLLAITGNTGEWLLPLQYFVGKRSNVYVIATESSLAQIKIFNDSQSSVINTVLGQTHPLPQTVVLGENYSFAEDAKVLSAQSNRTASTKETTNNTISIRFPKDGSVIPGNSPLVKGYGIPGKSVTVSIDSKPSFSKTVKVDKNGEWDVPVDRNFLPGKYVLTMTTQNNQQKITQLRSTYTLIKSGEQVLGETSVSTPSATLMPTQSLSPTLVPTIDESNDPIDDSPDPTDSVDETITQPPPPPVSGFDITLPYLMTGVGFVIAGVGLMLLL